MKLEDFVIVLTRPDESRNIGAVCRAMANNDIKDLRIVGKKEDYDDERVRILAIHAASIWENAKFFNSIKEATSDCTMAVGTTRRRGKYRKGKLLLPEEFAQISFADGKNADGTKIAAVFGNERTGLTDEEFKECTMGVTIPSSDDFASLNLSHAVQIISYHLFRKNLELSENKKLSPGFTPLTLERIDKTVGTITENLKKIGFFKVAGREDMENFWRSVLSRSSLSESEAQFIEKTFTKAAGLASKNSEKNI